MNEMSSHNKVSMNIAIVSLPPHIKHCLVFISQIIVDIWHDYHQFTDMHILLDI